MRKRNLSYFFDQFFWYLLYFLPIIIYVLSFICFQQGSAAILDLSTFFESCGFDFITDNFIYTTIVDLFGSSGLFPLFSSNVIYILTWFVSMNLMHLAVDVLLFMPRFAHKFLSKCFGD